MLHPGIELARDSRVAVFVVAYRDDGRVVDTLERIPKELRNELASIYVIDDRGGESGVSSALASLGPEVRVLPTPFEQRHGANLKLGLSYAQRRGYDFVALLHADGHFSPEALPSMLAPFAEDDVAAVVGSRMADGGATRPGGMPLVHRVGNRVLTGVQNRLLGSSLTDFHSGYRAYRVSELAEIPFLHNSDGAAFETEILIQLHRHGSRVVEVPTPSFYGGELTSHRGVRYALECLASTLRAVANQHHLVYHRRFDIEGPGRGYHHKEAPSSLHQHVLQRDLPAGARVVDLGAAGAGVARGFQAAGARVLAVDAESAEPDIDVPFLVQRLDQPFARVVEDALGGRADVAVALDVIEHLPEPEWSLAEIHRLLVPAGKLVASTANVAYLPIRLSLLLGQFNYGKRGILDVTHRRLFTIRTFRRALVGAGFRVDRVRGFGPPIQDVIGDTAVLRGLDRLLGTLARVWPSLFSYQFLVEAERLDSVSDLMERAEIYEA